jgi:hypothetical protein
LKHLLDEEDARLTLTTLACAASPPAALPAPRHELAMAQVQEIGASDRQDTAKKRATPGANKYIHSDKYPSSLCGLWLYPIA